jgi:hypothetical protein
MDILNTATADASALSTTDALLDAMMMDLPDLPPMGVPPSGHYNLECTFGVQTIGDENKEVITASWKVIAINELNDESERSGVAEGQQFTEFFFPAKKDKSPNTVSIGKLKQRLQPFVGPSGEASVRGIIGWVKSINVAATVKRTVNKKNEDQFNVDVKDIVVL